MLTALFLMLAAAKRILHFMHVQGLSTSVKGSELCGLSTNDKRKINLCEFESTWSSCAGRQGMLFSLCA